MQFKLRLEPYDPDARDADGDGLVQEGTAWERPAGSRIVDELGKEIKRGLTSPYRNTRFKIVDKDGNNLDYQPTYGKDADFDPKDEKPTLEKLGYRTIEQMGLPTVADMVLPSAEPEPETPAPEKLDPFAVLDSFGPRTESYGRLYNLIEYDDDQSFVRDSFALIRDGRFDLLLELAQELYGDQMEDDQEITLEDVLSVLADKRDEAQYVNPNSPAYGRTTIRLWRGGGVDETPELRSFAVSEEMASEYDDDVFEYEVPVSALYSRGNRGLGGEYLVDQSQVTRIEPMIPVESAPDVPKPRYPRQPPAHAMTGLAEKTFGKAETWEEFREILAETDIVFLDYETTGLVFDEFGRASSNGKPTQIGAVRMRDGKVIERFNVFVNPGIPMSEWEQWSRDNLVDGDGNPLTDEFFDDKPSIADAHRQLLDFIGEGTILGMQNAVFDDAVLAEALRESGIDWKPEGIIDTKEMSSMALPRWTPENPDGPSRVDSRTGETVPSNGLADITKYLGVDLGDKHHSADYDAEATGNVLTAIVDGAIEKGWSKDFLDKEKRDEKIRLNDEKFAKEIEQFERDRDAWEASQNPPVLPSAAEEPEPQNADEAVRRFLQQVETGSLPYQLDENEIAEEIFRIRESYAEETSQQVEEIVKPVSPFGEEQEQAIREVEDLLSVIKGLGTSIDEDEFIRKYATDPDSSDLGNEVDPWSRKGVVGSLVRLLPREITAKDGSSYTVRPTSIEVTDGGDIILDGLILDKSGKQIGYYGRYLDFDDEKNLVAHHSVLDISVEHQGKGIGSAFNTQLELVYRRLGVDRIELEASSDIRYEGDERTPMDIQRGVSFWPRQGFDWKDEYGVETTITLYESLFDDGRNEPNLENVYIEGISDGPPPVGTDRFDIAYFSSKQEWDDFASSFSLLKDTSFSDPFRPVAGDLMRWAGADEWVARRSNQYFPVYVKRLDSPTVDADPEPIIDDVVQLRPEVTKQRRESIDAVASILRESIESQKSIPSVLNFSYVSWETEADLEDEGAEPDEATLFGIQMIKMFEFSIQTRDGKKIDIFPNEITTNFNQGRRAFYLRGKINDGTDDIGTFDRTIRAIQKDDGSIVLYVDHDSLFIRDSYQGQGIGTAFNSELERIYRELGVSYIQTNASSSGGHYRTKYIGATHWPRSGFDWSDDFNKQEYIRVLDYLMEPDPESEEMMPSSMAYVEGLSSGPPPVGTDRFDIAYFSSVEEWENFVEAMEQARGESFDDENRIVAGDLVRWDGADDYFAGGEFLFVLIKRLMED